MRVFRYYSHFSKIWAATLIIHTQLFTGTIFNIVFNLITYVFWSTVVKGCFSVMCFTHRINYHPTMQCWSSSHFLPILFKFSSVVLFFKEGLWQTRRLAWKSGLKDGKKSRQLAALVLLSYFINTRWYPVCHLLLLWIRTYRNSLRKCVWGFTAGWTECLPWLTVIIKKSNSSFSPVKHISCPFS